MSLVQTCADAEASIARARSLFGSPGSIDVPNSATEITGAVQTATAGRDRTLDMAGGSGMPAYRDMVDRAVPPLTTASTSDSGLTTHLTAAAAVTQAGATRLDSIAAQTRTISQGAPAARTAAQQRAILTALRGQLQQVSQVVQTTQQQDGAAATQIRSLQYPKDAPASSGDGIQALDAQLPAPLQDFENQLQGLPPTPTPHPPLNVDELREQVREQVERNHDDALKQLILDGQAHHSSTHDIVRALGELAIAGASAIGGAAGAPETGGVSLYLGIATALGSGALAIDDLAKACS
jgi:hypothetical protein